MKMSKLDVLVVLMLSLCATVVSTLLGLLAVAFSRM